MVRYRCRAFLAAITMADDRRLAVPQGCCANVCLSRYVPESRPTGTGQYRYRRFVQKSARPIETGRA